MLKELSDGDQVIEPMLVDTRKKAPKSIVCCCLCEFLRMVCTWLLPYVLCFLFLGVGVAILIGGMSLYQVQTSVTSTATTAIATASHWLGSWWGTSDMGPLLRFSSVPLAPQVDAWAQMPIPSMAGWVGAQGLEAVVRGYPVDQVGDLVFLARNESSGGRRITPIILSVKQEVGPRIVVLRASAANTPIVASTDTPFIILYRAGILAKDYDEPSNVLLQCRL
jgi:hypothetical protein